MPPLVSIMMPCYNAVKTLPWALASLVAQTYTNWECILVDDGSIDRPIDLINTVNDPRIRYFRFEQNRGRAIARQYALDVAQGDYLCMLDADDWIYPTKLQCQLEVMENWVELAVLSTGMAIVDDSNNIAGVRTRGGNKSSLARYAPLSEPKFPPLAHAPSMIRMNIAKQTEYDPHFRLAQDVDFLLKILLNHPFGVLSDVTYVYTEIASVNYKKIAEGLRNSRIMFTKYREKYPRAVLVNNAVLRLKELIYWGGFTIGMGNQLIKRRSVAPTLSQVKLFSEARSLIYTSANSLFSTMKYTETVPNKLS